MRVLFTACPAASHLYPLVPLARAMVRAGHAVLLATGGGFAARAAESGVPVAVVGGDVDLLSIKPVGRPRAERSGWARMVALAENAAADTVCLALRWRPDLVVHTPTEFAGPLAAAVLNVPVVEHSFGIPLPRDRMAAAERETMPLYARYGVPPALASPSVLLTLCPPGFGRDDDSATPLRPESFSGPAVPETPELDVWLTLGTILPRLGRTAAVAPIVEAAHDLGLRIGLLGVRAAPDVPAWPWLPLGQVLRRCRVLAHHGGAGSTFAALTSGTPQLVVPHMTDQPTNAAAVTAAGVGHVVLPEQLTRDTARHALAALTSPGPERDTARTLATRIAEMPDADAVAADLTRTFAC